MIRKVKEVTRWYWSCDQHMNSCVIEKEEYRKRVNVYDIHRPKQRYTDHWHVHSTHHGRWDGVYSRQALIWVVLVSPYYLLCKYNRTFLKMKWVRECVQWDLNLRKHLLLHVCDELFASINYIYVLMAVNINSLLNPAQFEAKLLQPAYCCSLTDGVLDVQWRETCWRIDIAWQAITRKKEDKYINISTICDDKPGLQNLLPQKGPVHWPIDEECEPQMVSSDVICGVHPCPGCFRAVHQCGVGDVPVHKAAEH